MLTRRRWLAAAGWSGLGLAAACVTPRRAFVEAQRRSIRPVRVAADREIRTTVGLRPFRASGFVVRAEPLGDKRLVHNYGHGGGGISLSWGTADLAAKLALDGGGRRVAVLGCGAVGLATARLLQERGAGVTIYARELPPDTTSNLAGGFWLPTSVYDRDSLTPAFWQQFVSASHFAQRRFQTLVGPTFGVRWLNTFVLGDRPPRADSFYGIRSPLGDLLPELRDVPPELHPFHAPSVRQFSTLLIEPAIYLAALLDQFRIAGGRVVVGELASLDAVRALEEPVVVNCTGLGARALFGDDELEPVRGQLTFLLPQPEVDYAMLSGELYMFPRTDGILLGGTFQHGNWSLEADDETRRRMLAAHAKIFSF